jgi:hypothetical protein
VIAGPGAGLRVEKQVAGANAVLAVGRMPQNDLVLNDPEVSGKHVVISWSTKVSFWFGFFWLFWYFKDKKWVLKKTDLWVYFALCKF